MKKFALLLLVVCFVAGCQPRETSVAPSHEAVHSVMDDWHNAAAAADFDRYFNHFADSSSIFMGTDATEKWTVPEFKAYSKPHFDRGRAWSFTPVSRSVYFSENGKTAWFDEKLDTPNLGPCRGTGVLIKKNGEWKIAHYNLTVPIPNAIVDDVKNQIEEELNKSSEE